MDLRIAFILPAAMAALAAAPAFADKHPLKDAGDAVPGHPGLTYADLVRQAVPDLAKSADGQQVEGHFASPPRHLAGQAFEGDPADPAVLGFIEDRRILVGGKKRIVLLADLGGKEGRVEGLALLMLFDDAGKTPKLLDAADVGLDKDTVFAEQSVLQVGAGDDILVTYSEHDDADLTMGGYMIASPIHDRLRMVDEFGVTSVRLCGWSGVQTARFSTSGDAGHALHGVEATVTYAIKHQAEDCGEAKPPKQRTLTFHAEYRWDAVHGRYVAASSDLKKLAALNSKGF